ncbi:hypothetical protein L798_14064 [Zootermopsis nevadensis]|uniref:Uncharacterized protein n=1 Tax=Zootermopsis nevadensis TaxID=136037 RepID=A0A067RHN1_ZOONE|nr:hypothetical protein L798_14064 [Zootermopsis nevadensis]
MLYVSIHSWRRTAEGVWRGSSSQKLRRRSTSAQSDSLAPAVAASSLLHPQQNAGFTHMRWSPYKGLQAHVGIIP